MGAASIKKILFVGKPNSGKTSLFNQLTGLNQKIGNFAGVTVERKKGKYGPFEIIDLPGLQSMQTSSPEERISKQHILSIQDHETAICFVANGMQLADSLLLFSQIADLQVPILLAINFKDELDANKIRLDLDSLRKSLGCSVVLTNGNTQSGTLELQAQLKAKDFRQPNTFCRSMYDEFVEGVYQNNYLKALNENMALDAQQKDYRKRSEAVSNILRTSSNLEQPNTYLTRSKKLDRTLLHPVAGLLIFLAVMFVLFQAVFSLSAYPMDWIDMGISHLSSWSQAIPIGWLSQFLSEALIPGIGGVVIFIPQIAILFLLIGILEQTGYLSRISFISDSFLRRFGLSGHSVVPLMSSWACAIPAIMSTRIISDPRERLAVILASPLMTCSARLPVYTILIAIVFPPETAGWGVQGLALLILYLLGLIATLAVAWLVNKNSRVEPNKHWLLELPIFRSPNWKNIFLNVYQKTRSFVVQAGKVILAISILLWLLASFSPHDQNFIDELYANKNADPVGKNEISKASFELEYSYLGYIGKGIEPVIEPLGYDWKIGIALVSSFAAREVFVGTLSSIYSIGSEEESSIIERLRQEVNPETNQAVFNVASSVSLLLFYVFAMQCMSTMAIVVKETRSWYYAVIQFLFMLALAYFFAFAAYVMLS